VVETHLLRFFKSATLFQVIRVLLPVAVAVRVPHEKLLVNLNGGLDVFLQRIKKS
jgi:hypothetical protein